MTTETPIRKDNKRLNINHFNQAEYRRTVWHATADYGTTVDEMKNPDYWSNIASKLKPTGGDIIQVELEDGSAFFEFYVRAAGNVWANVGIIREVYFDKAEKLEVKDPQFEVVYKGKIQKFCVVRKQDNAVIYEGYNTKEEAVNSLKDYVKALAA